jgi:stage V sporulation protein AD
MAESLSLAAMTVDGGFADTVCALTSSHFCSSERQYRFPLEYGGVRAPTAQWTVTGAGAAILRSHGAGPYVTHVTTGCITDAGITDASNMGAAMAPAAYSTLKAHFAETGRDPFYYDAIVTGDLGMLGHDLLQSFFRADGVELGVMYMDCGMLIYDVRAQDVHAGGSGCGCSASVLCGHLLRGMAAGVWNRILFAATGALMSPTTAQQGDSIPGICHAVAIENQLPG